MPASLPIGVDSRDFFLRDRNSQLGALQLHADHMVADASPTAWIL